MEKTCFLKIVNIIAVSLYIIALFIFAIAGEYKSIRLLCFIAYLISNITIGILFLKKKDYPYSILQVVGAMMSIIGIIKNV